MSNATPGRRPCWRRARRVFASRPSPRGWRRATSGKPVASGPVRGDGPGEKISASVAGWPWLRLVSTLEEGGGNCHIWGDARLIDAHGNVTWLGSLTPETVSVGWGRLLVDKNWQNNPLRIGGRKFEHGVWVHADSNVCYRIEGKYERFEAWVGNGRGSGHGRGAVRGHAVRPGRARQDLAEHGRRLPRAGRLDVRGLRPKPLHLDWFLQSQGTRIEEQLLARAIGMLGSRARGGPQTIRRSAPRQDAGRRSPLAGSLCASVPLSRVLPGAGPDLGWRPSASRWRPNWPSWSARKSRPMTRGGTR